MGNAPYSTMEELAAHAQENDVVLGHFGDVLTPTQVGEQALSDLMAKGRIVERQGPAQERLLFLVGVGLGISLMHALFGFTGGWWKMIVKRRSDGVRAQIILFGLSAILFFPVLGAVFPDIKASGAMGPFSVSVMVGAFLFGIGMQMGGGCGSGTLFTVGWGQTDMLVTLCFFIIGATVGSLHLPWWLSLPWCRKT